MTRGNAAILAFYTSRWIKLAGFGVLAATLVATSPTASLAQAAAPAEPSKPAALAVPTIKLLAIGSLTAKATPKELMAILPSEARETACISSGKSTSGTPGRIRAGSCSS
jgi:hypothetical protein